MIEVKQICKSYKQKRVLHCISLSVADGEACAILGGNGAGKSTLIKGIMGLVKVDDGSVHTKQACAYLPEQPYLPLSMSAWQMVMHACKIHGQGKKQAALLLDEICLPEKAWHKRISTYSKGMRQRTAIAYALAGNPKCIVLDEPMSGLDAMGRKLVLELLKKRHEQGMSILMCSHMVTDIVKLCSKVFIVVQGEVKETVMIQNSTMDEANRLEQCLASWRADEALA